MSTIQPTTPQQPPLTTLPTELHLHITKYLCLFDAQALRGTSQNFHTLIPPATRDELLRAEERKWARKANLLYCNGCNCLRPEHKFSFKMQQSRKRCHGSKKKFTRFCMNCGTRPLTRTSEDRFKYRKGDQWADGSDGMSFWNYVRCMRCERCAKGVKNRLGILCWDCRKERPENATESGGAGGEKAEKLHGQSSGADVDDDTRISVEESGWMQDPDLYGWHCTDPSYWPNSD